jgi:hypothetical protein
MAVLKKSTTPADEINWKMILGKGRVGLGSGLMTIRKARRDLNRPLNKKELTYLDRVLARNPYPEDDPLHATYVAPDPRKWILPSRGLPTSYLSFLDWSNAGTFKVGERRIQFLDCLGLRDEMLENLYPMCAPCVIPFARIPGTPGRYCFDTTNEAVDGEFPVVLHLGGGMIWDRMPLARNFLEFCKGSNKSDETAYWKWWNKHKKGTT